MKGFLLGIASVALAVGVMFAVAMLGFFGMRADNPPSKFETIVAGRAMDASVARAAPNITNPVTADETNVAAGARLYREHCTLCHGDPVHQKAALADSLNPPAPQFMEDMADMPQNQNFYILQHGVRWTAMPSWKSLLSEQQIWQLVTFLSHMHDLPPAAKRVFMDDNAASRNENSR